jgi:hypothetical protein
MAAVLGKRAVVPSAARRVSSGAGVNRLVTRISEPFSSSRSVKCEVSKAKFFVGGNWKANGTVVSVNELVEDLNSRANDIPGGIDVCVSPSTIHIPSVIANLDANKYKVAAQVSPEPRAGCNMMWVRNCTGDKLHWRHVGIQRGLDLNGRYSELMLIIYIVC